MRIGRIHPTRADGTQARLVDIQNFIMIIKIKVQSSDTLGLNFFSKIALEPVLCLRTPEIVVEPKFVIESQKRTWSRRLK